MTTRPRLTTPADPSAGRHLVVTWRIDACGDEAASPRAAAESALATQRRASSIATYFEVTNPATGVTVGVDLDDRDDDMPEQAQWLHVATAAEIRESHIGGDDASPEAAELAEEGVTLAHFARALAGRGHTIARAIQDMPDRREDDRWALLDCTVLDITQDAICLAAAERQKRATRSA